MCHMKKCVYECGFQASAEVRSWVQVVCGMVVSGRTSELMEKVTPRRKKRQ